jgi:hypothetical protein
VLLEVLEAGLQGNELGLGDASDGGQYPLSGLRTKVGMRRTTGWARTGMTSRPMPSPAIMPSFKDAIFACGETAEERGAKIYCSFTESLRELDGACNGWYLGAVYKDDWSPGLESARVGRDCLICLATDGDICWLVPLCYERLGAACWTCQSHL